LHQTRGSEKRGRRDKPPFFITAHTAVTSPHRIPVPGGSVVKKFKIKSQTKTKAQLLGAVGLSTLKSESNDSCPSEKVFLSF